MSVPQMCFLKCKFLKCNFLKCRFLKVVYSNVNSSNVGSSNVFPQATRRRPLWGFQHCELRNVQLCLEAQSDIKRSVCLYLVGLKKVSNNVSFRFFMAIVLVANAYSVVKKFVLLLPFTRRWTIGSLIDAKTDKQIVCEFTKRLGLGELTRRQFFSKKPTKN